jgi:hypothetical protein
MKRALAILLFPAALALGGCGGSGDKKADASAKTCSGPFEATVYRGPTNGLSVKGDLTLRIDPSGSASGTVKQRGGPVVGAAGQVDGRAISLTIDMAGGRTLYGTGAARDGDVSECKGQMGGSLTGPKPGDSGDWGYALGG